MNDGYHKGFCSTWETENAEMEDGEKKTEDNYRRVPKGSGRADLVEKNPTLTTLLLSRVGISFMDTTWWKVSKPPNLRHLTLHNSIVSRPKTVPFWETVTHLESLEIRGFDGGH